MHNCAQCTYTAAYYVMLPLLQGLLAEPQQLPGHPPQLAAERDPAAGGEPLLVQPTRQQAAWPNLVAAGMPEAP
jgi:hypothetical protein